MSQCEETVDVRLDVPRSLHRRLNGIVGIDINGSGVSALAAELLCEAAEPWRQSLEGE